MTYRCQERSWVADDATRVIIRCFSSAATLSLFGQTEGVDGWTEVSILPIARTLADPVLLSEALPDAPIEDAHLMHDRWVVLHRCNAAPLVLRELVASDGTGSQRLSLLVVSSAVVDPYVYAALNEVPEGAGLLAIAAALRWGRAHWELVHADVSMASNPNVGWWQWYRDVSPYALHPDGAEALLRRVSELLPPASPRLHEMRALACAWRVHSEVLRSAADIGAVHLRVAFSTSDPDTVVVAELWVTRDVVFRLAAGVQEVASANFGFLFSGERVPDQGVLGELEGIWLCSGLGRAESVLYLESPGVFYSGWQGPDLQSTTSRIAYQDLAWVRLFFPTLCVPEPKL